MGTKTSKAVGFFKSGQIKEPLKTFHTLTERKVIAFMEKVRTQDEIDLFYCNQILPYDKRSIDEIISEIN